MKNTDARAPPTKTVIYLVGNEARSICDFLKCPRLRTPADIDLGRAEGVKGLKAVPRIQYRIK